MVLQESDPLKRGTIFAWDFSAEGSQQRSLGAYM